MLEKWLLIPILVIIFLAGWLIPPWYYRRRDRKRGRSFKEDSDEGKEITLVDVFKELREMRLEIREMRLEIRESRVTMWQIAITIIIATVGLIMAFLS